MTTLKMMALAVVLVSTVAHAEEWNTIIEEKDGYNIAQLITNATTPPTMRSRVFLAYGCFSDQETEVLVINNLLKPPTFGGETEPFIIQFIPSMEERMVWMKVSRYHDSTHFSVGTDMRDENARWMVENFKSQKGMMLSSDQKWVAGFNLWDSESEVVKTRKLGGCK